MRYDLYKITRTSRKRHSNLQRGDGNKNGTTFTSGFFPGLRKIHGASSSNAATKQRLAVTDRMIGYAGQISETDFAENGEDSEAKNSLEM